MAELAVALMDELQRIKVKVGKEKTGIVNVQTLLVSDVDVTLCFATHVTVSAGRTSNALSLIHRRLTQVVQRTEGSSQCFNTCIILPPYSAQAAITVIHRHNVRRPMLSTNVPPLLHHSLESILHHFMLRLRHEQSRVLPMRDIRPRCQEPRGTSHPSVPAQRFLLMELEYVLGLVLSLMDGRSEVVEVETAVCGVLWEAAVLVGIAHEGDEEFVPIGFVGLGGWLWATAAE